MTRSERLMRVKERYLRDDHPTRLGGLAANLARVHSFASNSGHMQAVKDLIVEGEHFIEWLAPEAELLELERLAQLQIELATWQYHIKDIWSDEAKRHDMARTAQLRSSEVLEMSGLLAGTGAR